ncbi:SagB/ThcOx family dehydrogenase [Erwinia sp. CPCC 100877]|nr:SagB/ThcOx family dehydrogenase [Erwinia sp. CPCC 100877]
MKESDRMKLLKLDNFNREKFLTTCKEGESNSIAWLINYKPNDNYNFPERKLPDDNQVMFKTNQTTNLLKNDSLLDNLKTRFSERLNKLTTPWSKNELFFFLEEAFGIRGTTRRLNIDPNKLINFRKYPSGGSMYPIEIYIYINKIQGLTTGFYKFSPDFHLLIFECETEEKEYSNLFPMSKYKLSADSCNVEESPFTVFLVANYQFSFSKYGNLAYKLALLEAGHMAQNACLLANALEKKSLPVCGIFEDRVKELLKLSEEDFVHYAVIMG